MFRRFACPHRALAEPAARRSTWSSFVAAALLVVSLAAGCAKRPVLYPNDHYASVGEQTAEREVEECLALAEAADLDSNEALEAGKRTAGGAAIGGVSGAVGGAITGRPGTGAAVGAATGAVGGFFSWLFSAPEPDPVYARYVDTCLSERGYQSIGWR